MKKNILLAGFLVTSTLFLAQETPKKNTETNEKQIEGVVLTKTKKAVEQKADRTLFDFSEQPSLNSGNVLEGMKKLPGLIVSDVAGMLYQGKMLDVYLDGRPLNISTNELNAFLEGMPANSVERIEIITQPGAEFPATSGGAILNIITSKVAKNYLSTTYSSSYNFTNYDKFRNRINNSINLNARNKYFGWQLSAGQNYRESMLNGNQDDITTTNSDRVNRGYSVKGGMTFDLGLDRLLLNYDLYHNNNDTYTNNIGILGNKNSYETNFGVESLGNRQNFAAFYQKRFFDDKTKKLDIKLNYNRSNGDFEQKTNSFSGISPQTALSYNNQNNSKTDNATLNVDFSQPLKILDDGKVSVGGLYDYLQFETENKGLKNLDYQRHTAAMYLEFQAKLKKFDFILGSRFENYDITGNTIITENNNLVSKDLLPFNQFKWFPNATVKYNIMSQVALVANYNKKISLPSISALNPNNMVMSGPNSQSIGQPFLQPAIYDNYEIKLNAFDYAFIGYNVSVANNQVIQKITRETAPNGTSYILSTQDNIQQMKVHNYNIGIPIPFMIFNTSLKEMFKFNFNPDKINFMYLYAGYQKHELPDIKTKGMWIFNAMTQFILPKDISLQLNYSYLTKNSNYYYFVTDKPFNHSLGINVSKKFWKDNLTVSLYADDIFNTEEVKLHSIVSQPYVSMASKYDTRRYGVSFNLKIPTKNKLAKEDSSLLNTTNKEDS
ncbi:MAG: TonB-dependent receptor, partial [Chryseobacterium sp.]|nr:TonB-dependent receptor [Candidatus Chryseobacterium enterohippi]